MKQVIKSILDFFKYFFNLFIFVFCVWLYAPLTIMGFLLSILLPQKDTNMGESRQKQSHGG